MQYLHRARLVILPMAFQQIHAYTFTRQRARDKHGLLIDPSDPAALVRQIVDFQLQRLTPSGQERRQSRALYQFDHPRRDEAQSAWLCCSHAHPDRGR